MLFNSIEFLFFFLPVSVIGYYLIASHRNIEQAIAFLVIASLFFYGYWNPIYVLLIMLSIGFNYGIGGLLSNAATRKKSILVLGVVSNLSLLAYFKYADFFLENINVLTSNHYSPLNIVLPLAISFFTFQQVSFLIDAWRGETKEYSFNHYCLFVTFFPQLIAGPIVHHKEMLPQFFVPENLYPKLSNFIVGLSIFAVGLFKKAVIADPLSEYVGPVFNSMDAASAADLIESWIAALAYTFQLYFDFSGYSDMAVGIARIFGIMLPINFYSPYKSTSIIEFWRRWHITLSRFLRDYLYIALGGNRAGTISRYRNLFLTMFLGGLWHGAGWTFVVWGSLHGLYLIINHTWKTLTDKSLNRIKSSMVYQAGAWLLTFACVVFSWVYFRAPDIATANQIMVNLLGLNGIALPNGILARLPQLEPVFTMLGVTAKGGGGSALVSSGVLIFLSALVALILPNTAQLFHRQKPVIFEHDILQIPTGIFGRLTFKYNFYNAFIIAFCFVASLLTLTQVSEFLYFQF